MATYIHNNIEVKLTGRYADKFDRAGKKIRIVEIEAINEISSITLLESWVLLSELAEILDYSNE